MTKSRHSSRQRKRQIEQVLRAFSSLKKEFATKRSTSSQQVDQDLVMDKLHRIVKDAQAITLK
jgi:hypothetical protein